MAADTHRLDQFHAKPLEARDQRLDRVIIQMLVVDRVEEGLLENVHQIGNLKHKNSVLRQQTSNALHDARQIIHVRKNIVGSHHFSRAMPRTNFRCQLRAEKGRQRFDTVARSFLGDAARRIHSHPSHARLLKEAQQRAVIGADVHDEAPWPWSELVENASRVRLEVRHKGR